MSSMTYPTLTEPPLAKRNSIELSSIYQERGDTGSAIDDILQSQSMMYSQRNNSTITNRQRHNSITRSTTDESTNLMDGLDDPDQFPDGGTKAWSVVIGSLFGILAAFGIMNTQGAIQAYISKHQLANDSLSDISWIFSVYSFMAFGGGIYSGPIFDKFGSKALIVVGSLCLFLGIFLTGECTNVYQFVLAFGVLNGFGGSLLMTPLYGVVSHWFAKNRASALGVASIGGSLGGVISPLILRSLYPKIGFNWSMRVLAFVYLSFLTISYILVEDRLPKNDNKPDPLSADPEYVSSSRSKRIYLTIKFNLSNSIDFKILKNKKYLFFVIALFLTEFSLLLTVTYFSSYSIAQGQTESTAFILLTVINSAGIPGRCIPGYLADKFGRFNLMVISSCITSVSMFTLWFPFGNSLTVLYVFAVIYGYSSASIFSLAPVCCSQLVEAKNFGKAYGTAYFIVSFIDLVGLVFGALVIDKGDPKGYTHLALMASVLAVVGNASWIASRYYVGGLKWIKC